MATTIVSTTELNNVALQTSGDTIFVTATGQINVVLGSAIFNMTSLLPPPTYVFQTRIVVNGSLSAPNGYGIQLVAATGEPGLHSVVIGASGSVNGGFDFDGIHTEGFGNTIQNAGQVTGGIGIWCEQSVDGIIQNDGIIAGLRGAGLILVDSFATEILNAGKITGNAGIELNNSTATILNLGEIRSVSGAKAAIDATTGSAGFALRNSGLISGQGNAIAGSAFSDAVTNSGTIDGNVVLGAGADVFHGKAGSLLGTLNGGTGNDTLVGGFGDQSIIGGSQNDRINGSAGDDLLTGGSQSDTFVFSRRGDDDTIVDFVNATDRIELSSFHFANFASVAALATDRPGGLLIDLQSLGGGTVFVAGFTKAQFDATDVIL